MIKGIITGQTLKLKDVPVIVSDSIDYLEAVFAFRSKDWEECEKWAHFSQGDVVYDIKLTENRIRKEDHLNLGAGSWKIYLHGTSKTGMRITTDPVSFGVKKSGVLNGQPLPEIPLSVAENLDLRLSFLEEVGGYPAGVSPYIISEAKGESIFVTDSAKAKFQGLKMYGKSEQFTTTGAQLMPLTYAAHEEGGVTFTYEGNRLTIKGTNTESYQVNTNSRISIPLPIVEGSYSVTQFSVSGIGIAIAIVRADGTKNYANSKYTLYGDETNVNLYAVVEAGKTVDTTLDIMVNAGDTLLPFEPYTGGKPSPSPEYPQEIVSAGKDGEIVVTIDGETPKTLTALTPNGLPGIKVASGGNWTDSTGQQWVSDVIDLTRRKYLHLLGVHTFTGEEDIVSWAGGDARLPLYYPDKPSVTYSKCMSNLLVSGESYAVLTGTDSTVGCNQGGIVFHFPGIQGMADYGTLVNTAKAKLKELYNAGTPLTVLYQLSEPYETDLTEEEMVDISALHTNYPVTTILNDEGVGMEVSYVADTKNYIDKKFNELAAAIVANA